MNLFPSHRYTRYLNWIVLVIITAWSITVVLSADGTPRLTYDSRDYLAASNSLRTYLQGRNPDGVPYLHRLPLLPGILHFFENKVEAARVMNILCLIASLYFFFLVSRSLLTDHRLRLLALLSVGFSYPWLQNHLFLWTEPVFSTLILAAIYCLTTNRSFLFIVLITGIAFFAKAAGLFLALGLILHYAVSRQFLKGFVLLAVSLMLFLSWELLSETYSDTSRSFSILSYQAGLSRQPYFDALSSWFLPRAVPFVVRLMILACIGVLCLVLMRKRIISFVHTDPRGSTAIVILTFILCYVALFGVPDYFEAERYLSVILPAAMLLVFAGIDSSIRKQSTDVQRITLSCVTLWCVYPVLRTINHLWL